MGGDARAGLAAADRALATATAAQPWTAEVHRLRGAFLEALGAPPAEIEAELRRAAEAAERAGAVAFEERLRNGWSSSMPPDDHRRAAHNR